MIPSSSPTTLPSSRPTHAPSASPSHLPIPLPTPEPTHRPTATPSSAPVPRPSPLPSFKPTPEPSGTYSPTFTPTHLPTYTPSAQPTHGPSMYPTGMNGETSSAGGLPQCVDMCATAFANTTTEFEWVSGGILTELRAIIVTLEDTFDVMALDKQFAVVNQAIADKLAPLSAQASAMAKEHAVKLSHIKQLKETWKARDSKQRTLAELKAKVEHKTTWQKAKEPLRIELTTIGTTLALVIGMVAARLAHGDRRDQPAKEPAQQAPADSETLRLTAGKVSRQYGAFQ